MQILKSLKILLKVEHIDIPLSPRSPANYDKAKAILNRLRGDCVCLHTKSKNLPLEISKKEK